MFVGGENFKDENEVKMLNPLAMAFIGDSIYSTFVKSRVLKIFKHKVKDLTKETAMFVNARSQKQALFKIMPLLTEAEVDIVKRARNTNIHTKAKNYTIEEYRHATALEALVGYLYLSKNLDRLEKLLQEIFREEL